MDKKFDVVIVGTGAAGLYAALNFPESVNILLVSKRELQLSNSSLAQGGVACVLDTVHDSYKLHITDTLIAGKYKNTLSAVEKLVTEGPSDVLKIKDLGVDFDLNEDGTMCKTLEAGHSRNRIVHHKDSTGKAIVDGLIAKVTQLKNVTVCDNALVYSIDKVLNGFYISILRNGEKLHYGCNYCLLATGGIGRVYKYTTNSAIATGDGIAFAYMLGARIKNLSRIQFHPTAFAADHGRERFLISEAVRGEGAVLLNCNGERFASNYDSRGELAPRDVVSNAVMLESIKTNSENFYLDITHKPADFVRNRFPMIYERCLEEGVDITKDRIPVFPCQHYLMGGIDVDLHSRTTVEACMPQESARTQVFTVQTVLQVTHSLRHLFIQEQPLLILRIKSTNSAEELLVKNLFTALLRARPCRMAVVQKSERFCRTHILFFQSLKNMKKAVSRFTRL